jgi:hypothetical protein
VNITVDLTSNHYWGEMSLFLSHAGVHVSLGIRELCSDSGFGSIDISGAITYDDEAANSFPCLRDAIQPPGTYRPPGAALAAFDGLDAAGEWVLTLADCCGEDPRTFHSMTLEVTVPEPATLALLSFALASLGFARRRKLH